jgi:hypothetical protein
MVPEFALVTGYLAHWAMRKAGRLAGRLDQDLDAAVDKLHELVRTKLGDDPALGQLESDARQGVDDPRTRQRVQLAVEDSVARDVDFAGQIGELLRQLQRLSGPSSAVSGDVAVHGSNVGGGIAGRDNITTSNKTTKLGLGGLIAIVAIVAVFILGAGYIVVKQVILKSSDQASQGDCVRQQSNPERLARISCARIADPDVFRIDRVVHDVQSPLFVCPSDKGFLDPKDNTLYCFAD